MGWAHLLPAGTALRLNRAMQGLLALTFVWSLVLGHPTVAFNAAMSLGVTFLPAWLERDVGIPMAPGVVLWITASVFLHAMGTVYGYRGISWYDDLVHVFMTAVVVGIGYAVVRAVDEHDDDVYLPPRFLFVFILLFTMAAGVLWEIFEFGLTVLSAVLELDAPLVQYGIDDTVTDLLWDSLGGLLVAAWGHVHFHGLAVTLEERFGSREGGG